MITESPNDPTTQRPDYCCSFCGSRFSEADAAKTCGRCAHFGGCKMVMCPKCGYEMPQTPSLIKILQRWGKRKLEKAAR